MTFKSVAAAFKTPSLALYLSTSVGRYVAASSLGRRVGHNILHNIGISLEFNNKDSLMKFRLLETRFLLQDP